MNTKKSTLLTISIAAILTLSVIAIGEIPQAIADKNDKKDHDKKYKSNKNFKNTSNKPDFESSDCIVTGAAEEHLPGYMSGDVDCKMQAWLDKKGKELKYKIMISGMEVIDINDSLEDDLYQLHIHKNTDGTPENPKGPHVLDVYRKPMWGDADLVVLPVQGELNGVWDDGDHDPFTAVGNLEHLCNSEIFAAGHGDYLDNNPPGHHAPYVKMLLEPTRNGEKACKKLGFE